MIKKKYPHLINNIFKKTKIIYLINIIKKVKILNNLNNILNKYTPTTINQQYKIINFNKNTLQIIINNPYLYIYFTQNKKNILSLIQKKIHSIKIISIQTKPKIFNNIN